MREIQSSSFINVQIHAELFQQKDLMKRRKNMYVRQSGLSLRRLEN